MDGHYIYVDYNVLSSVPLEQVREAHFHIKEVTGVDIEKIFEDKDYLTFPEIRTLRKLGWKRAVTPSGLGGRMFVEPDDVADLWLFLLKKADPSIETLRVCEDDREDIHFYGTDQKGRHIGKVGYGLWNN